MVLNFIPESKRAHASPPKNPGFEWVLKIENFMVIFWVFPYNSENTAKERISDSNRA